MVSFTAKEFAFEGPDTIPAGLTMIHLTDAGQQLHHVQLIKLEQGKTFADYQAAVKDMTSGPPPAWAVPYGGVNPPAPAVRRRPCRCSSLGITRWCASSRVPITFPTSRKG